MSKLKEALYVTGLKANLLSIGQLCDMSCKVNFSKKAYTVANKCNETVMIAERTSDNCYEITLQGSPRYVTPP